MPTTATHRDAVLRAIRRLNASCEAINVSTVAARAGVDRSYIMSTPICSTRFASAATTTRGQRANARSKNAAHTRRCRHA